MSRCSPLQLHMLDCCSFRTACELPCLAHVSQSAAIECRNVTWTVCFCDSGCDVQSENAQMSRSNGGDTVSVQASERALLAYLLARWHAVDADFIIGHNIGPWDLTILLQRLQHHKVPHFSRIGRLKRQRVPNLSGGGGMYGGGASHVRATSP